MHRMLEIRARPFEADDNNAIVIVVSGPSAVGPPREFICRVESGVMQLLLDVPGLDPLQSIRLALKATMANVGYIYAPDPLTHDEPIASDDSVQRPMITLSLLPFGHGTPGLDITIDAPLRDALMNMFYCRVVCHNNHWHVHAFSCTSRQAIMSALHLAIERASSILCDSFVDQSGQ